MKKRPDRARQAAVRQAAASRRASQREAVARVDRPGALPLETLERISLELVQVERDRLALLARRDELVDELRAAGYPWEPIAAAAGCTRQALMLRASPR